ncbi:hypothetical protein PRVXH_002460 [Proteinivorax hydrogeniformans]|uniref:Lipoprotein n=1 Tax=Proteinivorax hydrogeniformans TaxID=1826727 RepID=A0AAU8HSG5_9FIRM
MKLILIMVTMLALLPGCSFDADDIATLIKEHVEDMEAYEAEYILTENGQQFKVIETYEDSGNYHKIIVIFPQKHKQVIERENDEITLSFYPSDFSKKIHINDFDIPQYSYVKTITSLSNLLDYVDGADPKVAVLGENKEAKVYYEKRGVKAIELNLDGKEYKIEFEKLIVN